ncbi:MAG TPA: sensor domain-containing diguanylate cyclase [Myxococcota bacterium]|nr:sensor domain-containing diguanylate cyclase [Myxococcota bacterium]
MSLGRHLGRSLTWFERNLLVESVGAGFALMLFFGRFSTWSIPQLAFTGVLAILVAVRLWRFLKHFSSEAAKQEGLRAETFQLELILLCAIYLFIGVSGGISSPFYPALFVLLAAAGGFDSSNVNRLAIVSVAILFELLTFFGRAGPASFLDFSVHVAAIAAFPILIVTFESAWTELVRLRHEQEKKKFQEKVEEDAKEYRMSGMMSVEIDAPREKRKQDLTRSSINQINSSMRNLLGVIEGALRPNNVAVYWLTTDDRYVTLKDSLPTKHSALLRTGPMESGTGLIGAILKSKKPLFRNNLRKTDRGITYYKDNTPIAKFIGVPLLEGERRHLRGVLLADRKVDVSFGEDDEKLMQAAALELMRTISTEERLNKIDLLRNEGREMYGTTENMISCNTVQDVAEGISDSLLQLFEGADFSAVVLEEEGNSLIIKAVAGAECFAQWKNEHLAGEIRDNRNLCSLAMRQGLILPDKPLAKRSSSQNRVFGEKWDPVGLKSVKVAPLKTTGRQQGSIGALVVGSTKQAFFHQQGSRAEDVRRNLETISNIAVLGIQSARRFELLDKLATTDPMTSLLNRRRFFEIMDEEIAAAKRYERPLTFMIADVDHFKRVNDTYGHQMGDEVLTRVARVLMEIARTTDRVGRIGGEEFAILLPQTDRAGSLLLSERFREEIAAQSFKHEEKDFSISLSLGICSLPEFARHEQELIQRADQALYFAKEHGRNQSVHYADIKDRNDPGGQT